MFYAVNHQRDVRPIRCCARNGSNIMLVPGGIPNQQVLETLRGQVNGLKGGIAHNALKAGVRRENTPQYGKAANGLGSKSYLLATSSCSNLTDVPVEQVEIDKGERHWFPVEYLFVLFVFAFALTLRFREERSYGYACVFKR